MPAIILGSGITEMKRIQPLILKWYLKENKHISKMLTGALNYNETWEDGVFHGRLRKFFVMKEIRFKLPRYFLVEIPVYLKLLPI